MSVRVRYAPSPTGSPHVGNIRTALFNWIFAKKMGGAFIARLEDTDRNADRYRPEVIHELEESLLSLGIVPDEWWKGGGEYGPYVQSERLALYQKAAEDLIASGNAYRCYCSAERLTKMREEQQALGLPPGYDRRCRYLSEADRARYEAEGAPSTVRLAVPLEGKTTYQDVVYGQITVENRMIDDQVLLKSNGWPTYHLAVVVDDYLMRITHVIRGEDWQPSTPKQIFLYNALGWEQPVWVHVPLILGKDRKKLGKRHGATQFYEFIRSGYLPETMFNFLCLLGWSAGEENREIFSVPEIIERFSLEGISRNPAIFDYDKLRWMNGEYIRALSPEQLTERCLPYLVESGLIAKTPTAEERAFAAAAIALCADRLKVLSEIADFTRFFFVAPEAPEETGQRKWLTGSRPLEIITTTRGLIEALTGDPSVEEAEQIVNRTAEALRVDRPPVIHTLRVCLTGRTVGPGLFELMSVLGKERMLSRLDHAVGWVMNE
jgi:glutamyl-tRNA synthetase